MSHLIASPPFALHKKSPNLLIAALSAEDYVRIAPAMETIELRAKKTLYEFEGPIEYAYFPEQGLISVLNGSSDGTCVEIAVISNKGFLGVSLALGFKTAMHSAVVEVPGWATRIRTEAFMNQFEHSSSFRKLILKYIHCRLFMISQWVLCNRIHRLQSRMARLFLIIHDQIGPAVFLLTHDFIASMLGTARSEVARCAAEFRLAGSIEYRHSKIRILNREQLEREVCECYWRVTEEFKRALGPLERGGGRTT